MAKKKRSPEQSEGKKSGSAAGGILKNIGKVIPGLEGLIKSLEKSPAFKERLKEVDKELERKIKETPSPLRAQVKRISSGSFGVNSGRPLGIPPGASGKAVRRKSFSRQTPVAEPSPSPQERPEPKERPPELFDEGEHVKVIAEIPGVEEKDIKINLEKDGLTISVDVPDHKYQQDVKLPCEPKGTVEKSYKNGILEVKIKK